MGLHLSLTYPIQVLKSAHFDNQAFGLIQLAYWFHMSEHYFYKDTFY